MKRLILFCLLCVLTGHSAAAQPDDILGKWQDAAHPEKQVEFYKKKDNKYTGKIINDQKNASRNNAILFRDLVWNETSRTYQGILINPDNLDEFKVEIRFPDSNTFQFKAGKFVFSRTFLFKRI